MPLFELEELASFVQRDLRRSTAELVQELVEDAVYGHPALRGRITDPPQRGLKGVALEVARRALLNPANVQAESANGTSVTYGPAGGRGVELTDREVKRLRELVGNHTSYMVDFRDEGLGVRVANYPDTPPLRWWPT